uniref:Homoserine O-acetyltransferase n=1 Tax=Candidatus Methanophagaceae archaeon ANME-1 ERB6 TaxID=2759912 RepID=A0A7G9Z0T2_9EURY|nr:homoserine O-acetyltransferase [Methanosarcinales archaeon ANME-1 ERB6]
MAMEALEVGDVMTPQVVTEDEEAPVTKISADMEVSGIGSVVITKEGKPTGIITDRDIATKVIMKNRRPGEIKAKEIMSSPLTTIEPDASIEKACELLAENGIRRVPVIEDDKLVGIISVRNILTRNPMCVTKFYPLE